MTQRGEEQIEKLREEAICPGCKYSLRGLPGEVVTCPECGREINIALLIAEQWYGPWFKAPDFNILAWPVVWTVLALVVIIFSAYSFNPPSFFDFGALQIFLSLSAVAIWIWIIKSMRRRFGYAEALKLSAILHVTYLFYLSAVVVFFVAVEEIDLTRLHGLSKMIKLAMYSGLLIGLIYLALRCEKYVGRWCIRRHLQQKAET